MGSKFTHIEVTQADIDKAFKNHSARCVVATALARTVKGATRVEVDTQTIRFTKDGERHIYLTPWQVSSYVVAFDAGDDIEPFTFRLWEDRRVTMKRRMTTAAGREKARVHTKVREKKMKVAKAKAIAADPAATPEARAVARARAKEGQAQLEVAQAELEEVRANVKGKPLSQQGPGERSRPPRIRAYKTHVREYGHRLMRINQG